MPREEPAFLKDPLAGEEPGGAPLTEEAPARHGFRDALLAFLLGNFFSIQQFSYFFLLEAYVSSRSISFFIALFFWLAGVLIGIRVKTSELMPAFLSWSVGAYLLARLFVAFAPYGYPALFFAGGCAVVSGAAAGYFFPWARKSFPSVKHLFFHENNGFILGILISIFAAIRAGGWFLMWGAPVAIFPVALVAFFGRRKPAERGSKQAGTAPERGDDRERAESRAPARERDLSVSGETVAAAAAQSDRAGVEPPTWALTPVAYGIHFGILQAACFLTIQVFFSATFVGYFAVVLAWLAGVVFNLRRAVPRSLSTATGASLLSYYVLLITLVMIAPYRGLLPILALLVAMTALPAGGFFRIWANKAAGGSLFFHENNGFVLGYLLSLVAFVQWGVDFLYWAPIFSFALARVAQARQGGRWSILIPLLAAPVCFLNGALGVAAVLALVSVVALVASVWRMRPVREASAPGGFFLSRLEARAVLFLSGMGLLLLQYLILREFSNIMAACELSILIVALAYFTGFSVGYGASSWLRFSWIRRFLLPAFFMQNAVIALVKPVSGAFIDGGYGLEVLIGLLFFAAFATSSVFSIMLPLLIEASGARSLPSAYTWDLIGAVTGVALLIACVLWAPPLLWPSYALAMTCLVILLLKGSRGRLAAAVVTLACTGLIARYQSGLLTYGTEDYYRSRGYEQAELLYSANSFYHNIEVIETYRDRERKNPKARISFINGVVYFRYRFEGGGASSGETGLSEFTYYLAQLPARALSARLGRPLKVLILGGGSLYSLYRVHYFADHTTLVEIDPRVIESARRCWGDINQVDILNQEKIDIRLNDAKHFLRTTDQSFDLIVMDISAPYYLGTSILHCKEFFQLVKSRLADRGIFAESTQSRPYPSSPDGMGMKILRAVADVFPYWKLVDGQSSPRGSHGYVYASREDLLSVKALRQFAREDGMDEGIAIYEEGDKRFPLLKTTPYTLHNMETLLSANFENRVKSRLGLGSGSGEIGLDLGRWWRESRLIGGVRRTLARTGFRVLVALVVILAGLLGFLGFRRGRGGRDSTPEIPL